MDPIRLVRLRHSKRIGASFLTLILCLLSLPAAADPLAGPQFSDPAHVVPMPPEWVARGVVHAGVDGEEESRPVDLKVIFDQEMHHVLAPAIAEFARTHDLEIAVADGACGHAAAALFNKQVDMGGFCCPPRHADRLPGLRFITLGVTAVTLLTHPDNPIESITTDQARLIFAGEISRWSQLAGPDGASGPNHPILPVARLHCKPRPGHWRLILDNEDQFSPELQEVGTIPDMITVVASQPRAIGHAAFWFANDFYRNHGVVRLLKVDGVSPGDTAALAEGRYPFYKTFSLTVWETPNAANPHAAALADFLLARMETIDPGFGIAAPAALRHAGWRFSQNELIGAPP